MSFQPLPFTWYELDRPQDRGRLESRVAVRARRVVDEGHPERIGVLRPGPDDRLVGLPAAPRNDARSSRRRDRAQRHLRDRAPHRQRPRTRDAADRAYLEPFAAADPHRLAEPPATHRTRLPARRVGRVLHVLAHRPPRRPAACRPDPQLEPPRALPVDADELEWARRARDGQRPLAVERKVAHLQRREPRRSGGGQRQCEQKGDEDVEDTPDASSRAMRRLAARRAGVGRPRRRARGTRDRPRHACAAEPGLESRGCAGAAAVTASFRGAASSHRPGQPQYADAPPDGLRPPHRDCQAPAILLAMLPA